MHVIVDGSLEHKTSSPEIILVQKIDESAYKSFREAWQKQISLSPEIIGINVESRGGSVLSAMAIHSIIKSTKVKVCTYAGGQCMSAGLLLISGGTKGYRYASEDATFMIHDASAFSAGKVTDLISDVKEFDREKRQMLKWLETNCAKEPGYFDAIVKKKGNVDVFFTAKQALKHGLIDYIGVPTLKCKSHHHLSMSVEL